MLAALSHWGSLIAGIVLLTMCVLGVRAFAPRLVNSEDPAARMLAGAIVMGFVGGAINTLYWQIWGQIALAAEVIDVFTLRFWGGFLDIPFKLSVALAVLMHLAAWRRSLPPHERAKWSILGMAFYPTHTGFFARAFNAFNRCGRR